MGVDKEAADSQQASMASTLAEALAQGSAVAADDGAPDEGVDAAIAVDAPDEGAEWSR